MRDKRDVIAECAKVPDFGVPGDRLNLAVGSPVQQTRKQDDQPPAGATVEPIGQIGGTIEQIATGTSSIVEAADQQKLATEEIATSATGAASLTKDVTANMESVKKNRGGSDERCWRKSCEFCRCSFPRDV
jgi:hypothetical protein